MYLECVVLFWLLVTTYLITKDLFTYDLLSKTYVYTPSFEVTFNHNFIILSTWLYNYSYSYAMQKHPWCKKSVAKSEAPVTFIFCMLLKDVISGGGQGLLIFNHFVDAAIYNHV